jgi:hypothetical protein
MRFMGFESELFKLVEYSIKLAAERMRSNSPQKLRRAMRAEGIFLG